MVLCDAAGGTASHTNSSRGPDVMMDGIYLIPVGFLDVFVLAIVNVSASFINTGHSFMLRCLLFRPISATVRAPS
jgi:hypothetical protein